MYIFYIDLLTRWRRNFLKSVEWYAPSEVGGNPSALQFKIQWLWFLPYTKVPAFFFSGRFLNSAHLFFFIILIVAPKYGLLQQMRAFASACISEVWDGCHFCIRIRWYLLAFCIFCWISHVIVFFLHFILEAPFASFCTPYGSRDRNKAEHTQISFAKLKVGPGFQFILRRAIDEEVQRWPSSVRGNLLQNISFQRNFCLFIASILNLIPFGSPPFWYFFYTLKITLGEVYSQSTRRGGCCFFVCAWRRPLLFFMFWKKYSFRGTSLQGGVSARKPRIPSDPNFFYTNTSVFGCFSVVGDPRLIDSNAIDWTASLLSVPPSFCWTTNRKNVLFKRPFQCS